MEIKCPNCGSNEVYNIYSREVVEEDIYCGTNIVEYECECGECGEDFNCVIRYTIADVVYE